MGWRFDNIEYNHPLSIGNTLREREKKREKEISSSKYLNKKNTVMKGFLSNSRQAHTLGERERERESR